mmetsp:Transcript_114286/g.369523  ORF Transcript_114286/g.369523 Transcript_114286/m.369523 type:complete len:215 (+) Transcript_114286:1018-1662(+)
MQGGLHVKGAVVVVLRQALDLQVVLEGEVAASLHPWRQLGCYLASALDLVGVDSQACDVRTGGPHDAAHRPANAATNVKNVGHVSDHQLLGDEVLGVADGNRVRLGLAAEPEVEGITPTILIELIGEIVEGPSDIGVVCAVLVVALHTSIDLAEVRHILVAGREADHKATLDHCQAHADDQNKENAEHRPRTRFLLLGLAFLSRLRLLRSCKRG